MPPRPSFDRELLIPIVVGIVSMIGLAWIFLTNERGAASISPTLAPTTIPFEITRVEIEVRTPAPSATPTPTPEERLPTATGSSPNAYPGPPEETPPPASTLVPASQPGLVATSTADRALPLGKHDNTHPNIAYDRHWAFKMNSGTENAYKGTLHVSSGIGSEASFYFTGQRLYVGYQRGRNFGTVTVLIDNQPYRFHQQAFDRVWRSPELSPGLHSVRIIHESGETINLDYIEVWGQS